MAVIFVAIATLIVAYYVGHLIYAKNGHPLADIPGPISCTISTLLRLSFHLIAVRYLHRIAS